MLQDLYLSVYINNVKILWLQFNFAFLKRKI